MAWHSTAWHWGSIGIGTRALGRRSAFVFLGFGYIRLGLEYDLDVRDLGLVFLVVSIDDDGIFCFLSLM
jgi:hypothetical protein